MSEWRRSEEMCAGSPGQQSGRRESRSPGATRESEGGTQGHPGGAVREDSTHSPVQVQEGKGNVCMAGGTGK